MHFVYVLRSCKNGRFYIGQTANLEDRLARHNEGRVPSTKGGRPWNLVHVEKHDNRNSALLREKELKNWHSHNKLQMIIENPPPG